MNHNLITVEGFEYLGTSHLGSCVVGAKKPPVGSTKAKWSQGRGQTKSISEDFDDKDSTVLENLHWQGRVSGLGE